MKKHINCWVCLCHSCVSHHLRIINITGLHPEAVLKVLITFEFYQTDTSCALNMNPPAATEPLQPTCSSFKSSVMLWLTCAGWTRCTRWFHCQGGGWARHGSWKQSPTPQSHMDGQRLPRPEPSPQKSARGWGAVRVHCNSSVPKLLVQIWFYPMFQFQSFLFQFQKNFSMTGLITHRLTRTHLVQVFSWQRFVQTLTVFRTRGCEGANRCQQQQ